MKVWVLFEETSGSRPLAVFPDVDAITDYLSNGRAFENLDVVIRWGGYGKVFITLPEGDGFHKRFYTAQSSEFFN